MLLWREEQNIYNKKLKKTKNNKPIINETTISVESRYSPDAVGSLSTSDRTQS